MTEFRNLTPEEKKAVLIRSQIHTLRVQVHAVERRLFDMEMAQDLGAQRVDVHADEIKAIKETLAQTIASLDGLASP